MNDAWALARPLRGALFSAHEAAAVGVGDDRLRSHRANQLQRGVWVDAAAQLTVAVRAEAALRASAPGAWISHATAAQLHGLRLPPRLRTPGAIDVTVPSPVRAPRGAGIRGRQRELTSSTTVTLDGLRVTSIPQTFVDATDYLSVSELVALGDGIVDARAQKATREELAACVSGHRGRRGHRGLLQACAAVKPNNRSWSESVARLAMEASGIPEPWFNVPVVLPGGGVLYPDAALWRERVLFEIEGDHHRTERQRWLTDLDRYNQMQQLDLVVMRLVVTTPNATFARLAPMAALVRERKRLGAPLPTVASWCNNPPTYPSGWLLQGDARSN